jgi:hypothetical protein
MRRYFLAFVWICLAPQASANCTDNEAEWEAEGKDGNFYQMFSTQTSAALTGFVFYEWRNNRAEQWKNNPHGYKGGMQSWELPAKFECSFEDSICKIFVPVNKAGGSGKSSVISAIVDMIDEDKNGLSEIVVFGGLEQLLSESGGASVEWKNGFSPNKSETVTLPNVFRFQICVSDEPE